MEKIKLLLYCTKQPLYLVRNESDKYYYTMDKGTLNDYKNVETYNGKIVAECDFEVEEHKETTIDWLCMSLREKIIFGRMCRKANIDELECLKYANGKPLYAIHIKNLNIFDEPKELFNYCGKTKHNLLYYIEKAPQNMMYCYMLNGKNDKYILISIRAEWLCKILNGEKTIECRKRILKEMVK